MGRPLLSALALLAVLASRDARAARPFNTDDARVVDPGGYQIEAYVKDQLGIKETEYWFCQQSTSAVRSIVSSSPWAET